jgi:uncharacterized membrane protein
METPNQQTNNEHEEVQDLKNEIEKFRQEKDRVRAIVGQIGGVPKFNTKAANIVFVVLLVVCMAISFVSKGTLLLAMLEVAVAAVSVKLIFLIHNLSRVSHFQLWILSSLEWQINELTKAVNKLTKQQKEDR